MHKGVGGRASSICPGEVFLTSLAACSVITLGAVATHMGLKVQTAGIAAIGFLDLRGTLAVDSVTPVGFQRIELEADIETDASPQEVQDLLTMTEKYCVVFQTLASPPQLSIRRKGPERSVSGRTS